MQQHVNVSKQASKPALNKNLTNIIFFLRLPQVIISVINNPTLKWLVISATLEWTRFNLYNNFIVQIIDSLSSKWRWIECCSYNTGFKSFSQYCALSRVWLHFFVLFNAWRHKMWTFCNHLRQVKNIRGVARYGEDFGKRK